jgi:uncharacterized repeat protein (TIGR02543 family)
MARAATNGDTTPPVLTGLSVTPSTIDVSNGSATLTVSAHITDDLSGVGSNSFEVEVQSPGGMGGSVAWTPLHLQSGTDLDGTWTGTMTVPQYAAAGTDTLYVGASDNAGNYAYWNSSQLAGLGLQSTVTVQDTNGDTVTFNSAGGSAVASISGLDGTTITLPAAPTRAGYGFDGWFAASSGGSALTSPYTLAGSVTLYAHWTANATDTVTFNSAGGSAVASISGLDGTTITLPAAPTRAGYGFDGWFAASSGGSALTSPYTLAGSVTLYAHWTANARPPLPPPPPPPPPPPSSPPPSPSPSPPPQHGYWLVGSDGGIFTYGSAHFYGSTGNLSLQRPVVGITPTHDRGGYWLVASDGGIFSFGDSGFYGSIPGVGLHPAGSGLANSLSAPIVGMVPSSDGGGYFMVASDGGVFAFGDAKFAGSCPGIGGCSGSAVAVMPDASGNGYWLVTSSGTVYAFGDAPYFGAPGPQGAPVTSAVRTPDGKGYWILFANGSVASYGDAANFGYPAGALGGLNPASAIFSTADGGGYWVASGSGGVYPYGDAPNDGSMAGTKLNGSIIAGTGW